MSTHNKNTKAKVSLSLFYRASKKTITLLIGISFLNKNVNWYVININ